MDKINYFSLKASGLAFLCGIYSSLSCAAPTLELAKSTLLAGYPAGSFLLSPKTALSEDGRFLLVSVYIQDPNSNLTSSLKVYDLYRNQAVDLKTLYPAITGGQAISASGRYVLARGTNSSGLLLDIKTALTITGLPTTGETLSGNGRYVGHTYNIPSGGFLTHGYVYDVSTATSTLATPKYGTDTQLVPSSSVGYPNDILLSADGKVFFWGTDGDTTQFAAGKPNTRDLLAHKLGVGSTVNQRASNCNNCGDAVTNKGSNAYEYAVSGDGGVAAFRSAGNDYGYTTSAGAVANGRSQLFARDLNTLKVDLISAADDGFIESGAANIEYGAPSISSDGRFVVFKGDSQIYIRDRFAKKKQLLGVTGSRALISGNGKAIVVERNDGWYSLPNPYLVTTTDFTSNYLFANVLLVGPVIYNFDHMLLTGNNTWTGYIDYPGTGNNSIRIDLGGQWSGATYVAGSSAAVGFGDNNGDGTAAFGEAAITLTQGAGRYKVSFNDQTNQYTVKKLVNINFNCYNGYTTLGQSVYVTGNIPELGDWSPANAVKLNPTSYPTWTASLALPSNTNIEWKCIKRDELNPATSLVWEGGGNNQFNPTSSQTADGHF